MPVGGLPVLLAIANDVASLGDVANVGDSDVANVGGLSGAGDGGVANVNMLDVLEDNSADLPSTGGCVPNPRRLLLPS